MTPRHPLVPRRTGAAAAALGLVLVLAPAVARAAPADGAAARDDVPQGTVAYRATASFTNAGRPRDLLLHPESKKLYVGSDDLPETTGANESGLHVLDPADGTLRSTVGQVPGPTGALGRRAVHRLIAPLPGDGVVFGYPLRGIGTAKDGDPAAAGAWAAGATVTDAGPGVTPGTVLIAQGPVLSEVDVATAAVRRSLTLEGGDTFAVDPARGTVWFTDTGNRRVHRIDTAAFRVAGTVELPAGDGLGGFTEVDPRTGALWVGLDTSIVVHDATGVRLGTIRGTDLPRAARFDPLTQEAFVAWQDEGDPSRPGSDGDGALAVYRTTDLREAAAPVALPGNHGQSGFAALAVTPGGGSVFVSSPAEGKITRLERSMSPKVTEEPSDRSAAAGTRVSLTARAEGTPEPSVAWQSSADGGKSWQPVAGATAAEYAFTAEAALDGRRYRAEFRNTGGAGHTAPVTLTVTTPGSGTAGGTGGQDGAGTAGPGDGTTGGSGSGSGSGSGGSGGSGGSAVTGATAAGATAHAGPAGTVGGTGTTPAGGGALASTGTAVATLAGAAVVLTAAGWGLTGLRRRRPRVGP
ncbi:hypothetical protein Slala03_53420 [Streptomyces lavendulae subsp. lavendulae]|uniref:hypothetical protein n=1 Tax=Streptomyces lavendulae TaxID=1914 RepID=UPI0024A5AF63|nr:hypothetical protein [Streptomyces lavendulae]GLV85653.1 hypothetical protein Slala03_53420 [Streptomyces lavendulae subsp. lavendulae]